MYLLIQSLAISLILCTIILMKKIQPSTLNHQYKKEKRDLTPFETYSKHSNALDVSTKQLRDILLGVKGNSLKILDVGCSDGLFLINSLPKGKATKITFLEPSKDPFEKLKRNTKQNKEWVCINQTFEEFYQNNKEKYDIVLASHLYHFPREEYKKLLSQLISILKDSGTLIWIERGIDEITDFKKRFKTMLLPSKYPKNWIPPNYKRALEILKRKEGNTKLIQNNSVLRFPYTQELDDVIAIVEFFLNIEWNSIPRTVQEEILEYIVEKKGILQEEEGIVIYSKHRD